eukprot:4622985-Pyramimonas_sp.AAC.1
MAIASTAHAYAYRMQHCSTVLPNTMRLQSSPRRSTPSPTTTITITTAATTTTATTTTAKASYQSCYDYQSRRENS